jgi:outer membrane protein assembly factor BamB
MMNQRLTHESVTRHVFRNYLWYSILLLVLTLSISGAFIAHPRAHAAPALLARINIIPKSGAYSPKQSIKVSGFNFAANEQVNVYWNYTGPGTGILKVTAITDGTGSFATSFKKPLAPTGIYTIAAIGHTSGFVATAPFQLLPQLTLNPLAGGPGTKLYLFGHAFGAFEAVNIYWNYTGPGTGILLTTVTGDSTGSFKTTASVPGGTTPGLIPIAGVGQTSNAVGSYNFLLYPPTLALAPLSGSAGTSLTLSAYGFKGLEKVNIFWNNGATPVLSVSTTTYGYLSPTIFTVPALTVPGNYVVKAVGLSSHTSITNTFTIVPPGSSLSLVSGPVGAATNISGQGYSPGELVNILWDYSGPATGTLVTSMHAGTSGTLSGSFNVPSVTNGTYTVAAVGATSNSVTQNTFTVGNGLAVSPTATSPGSSVTATGTGYQNNESVTFYLDSTAGSILGTASADASGNVSSTITIPNAAAPGNHNVIGVGQISSASFTTSVDLDTSWNQFGFDTAHHRQNYGEHGVDKTNAANLILKWAATTGTTNTDLEDSPVYANGIVYIVTPDGTLNAYNAANGNLKWHYVPQIGFPLYSSPLVDPITNMVFFGTVPNFDPGAPSPFYALDAQTGSLKWSLILPWNEYGFPSLAFKTIYVGTSRETGPGTAQAIDEISGQVVWQQSTNGGVWGSFAADTSTNTVFTSVGNPANTIIAYNATTGALIWQYAIPNSGPDDDPGSGLTVSNGLVYADSKIGSIYAINENTGTLAWSTSIGTLNNGDVSSQAVSINGVLYVGSLNNNLYALNATTGAVLWKTPTGSGIDSTPAFANGVVYVGSFDKKIYAIDASTGAILWSYTTGNLVFSSPILVNGWLYCGSTDGKLYAFSF